MLARAYWYKNGLADSTQLREGSSGQALPTHHHTSNRGRESPYWSIKTSCLAWTCCPWTLCTGGWPVPDPPCTRSFPLLVTLGPDCFLTPTPESGYPPFLYFIYTFPYSTLVWTCLAGTLSTCNFFLSAADLGLCL